SPACHGIHLELLLVQSNWGMPMTTIDVQLIELELRWREADDMLRAARAELAAGGHMTDVQKQAVAARAEQAIRLKQSIIKQIEALEESAA
ncbi:MAG TPA: hypothetical protein VG962_08530, partial [Steroidobacteraceae bacterium]|nr:hypothetical protein [Steroidobacteraceae bacterium]